MTAEGLRVDTAPGAAEAEAGPAELEAGPAELEAGPAEPGAAEFDAALRWLKRTPNRTFVLYPALVLVARLLTPRSRRTPVRAWALALLPWGYLQYRRVGDLRTGRGGGGPGIQVPPDHVVQDGPYAYVRNPMYLGHLIFLAGLALAFRSRLAALLLVGNAAWFHRRVVEDEARLAARFGPEYEAYRQRVKRWIPGLL